MTAKPTAGRACGREHCAQLNWSVKMTMECNNTILEENRAYWSWRAPGYSEINREELTNGRHRRWKECLAGEIAAHFPGRSAETIRALDIGTGPGFFAILLAEFGCDVTAIDLTAAMLREAKNNAGEFADRIRFMEMNAEELSFDDAQFDVIVSRNLTWDLPHPERAYAEWIRVMKPGGLLLNFDANWYSYLYDDAAKEAYERDRANSAASNIEDRNVGENFDVMEEIARRVPLSGVQRPGWDLEVLRDLGMSVTSDDDVWQRVWSQEEKINFASTPMFLVRGRKQGAAAGPGLTI